MSVIGTFTPTRDGGWAGTIRTLTIAVKARFVPNDNRENDRAPDFRAFAGRSELGAAWRERSGGETLRVYLRVRLDDPLLPGPLSAALFGAADGQTAQLVWKRRPAADTLSSSCAWESRVIRVKVQRPNREWLGGRHGFRGRKRRA